ncbi:MAG: hypothetical protein ALECFALPRED_010939 [Alectoria fallacina]|uniref:Uncharacterized protein n=1 Tax=Alectoria fallacina TaxID=1903189 RepID=A0A8H3IKG5_9LECA|nr:MAG: hypothetical protein ALECFALPRED_010939 [Alectoria fallacina]
MENLTPTNDCANPSWSHLTHILRRREGTPITTLVLQSEPKTRLLQVLRMEARQAMIISRLASMGINTDALMQQRTPEELAAIRKDPMSVIKDCLKDNPRLQRYKLATFDKFQPLVKERPESIFNHFLRLRAILGKHEPTLHKRWCKKSPEQRRKMLLSAWPDMAPNHSPDLKVLWQEASPTYQSTSRFRDAFMFPYINLQDLMKTKPLLSLIRSPEPTYTGHIRQQ